MSPRTRHRRPCASRPKRAAGAAISTACLAIPTRKADVVRDILRSERIKPDRLAVVGDGISDEEAARANGCVFIKIADAVRSCAGGAAVGVEPCMRAGACSSSFRRAAAARASSSRTCARSAAFPWWAVPGDVAKALDFVDRAIVSTDHPEIARVAKVLWARCALHAAGRSVGRDHQRLAGPDPCACAKWSESTASPTTSSSCCSRPRRAARPSM